MIDDKHLERRAEELAIDRLHETSHGQVPCIDGGQESDAHGYKDATLHHLRIHLKTLKVLEGLDHGAGCAMYDDLVQSTGMECTCGLDEHIALLRKEVGVTS